MQHVLGETPSIIHALEDYYGFGYPWDKLDLLAAPDFAAGAMENAGPGHLPRLAAAARSGFPGAATCAARSTSPRMSWRTSGPATP